MRSRFIFALALLSALTGCVTPPPRGSLVEYHEGARPVTRAVKCEANYALVSKDSTGTTGQIFEHHIIKGERVGFRREPDGSVIAVAPGHTLTLPPGSYAWEVVPGSIPSWRERMLCETRERGIIAARILGITTLVVLVVAAIIGIVVLSAKSKDHSADTDF